MTRRGDRGGARRRAMLDAAERLFSERGFTAVSVRDIAREAGVSHALVHRYLGPKEEIYRAVLKRNEDVIRDAAGDTEDLDAALSLMIREGLANHRDYLRLVAHSALHGLPYETTIGRFRATERLVELAEMKAAGASGSRPDAVGAARRRRRHRRALLGMGLARAVDRAGGRASGPRRRDPCRGSRAHHARHRRHERAFGRRLTCEAAARKAPVTGRRRRPSRSASCTSRTPPARRSGSRR